MEGTTRSAVLVRGLSCCVCVDMAARPRASGSVPVSWR